MSDLKDLAFTVQQSVDVPPFESLTRRATHRRNRRRVSVAATVSAVVAAVLIVGTLSGGSSRTLPIAPQPTVSMSDRDGEVLVNNPNSNVESFAATDSTHWAAAWVRCPNNDCASAAVLSSNGRKAYTPVRSGSWATLVADKEPIAVYGPNVPAPVGDDDPPGDGLLVRLTDQGPVRTALRYLPPTRTWEEGELVTDKVMPGVLVVLNLKKSTLRRLDLPGSADGSTASRSPIQDSTGRWWFLGGRGPDRMLWTDDRGKSWHHEVLDPNHAGTWLAVSGNGRTVVATSTSAMTGDNWLQRLEMLKVSTDAGASWRTVSGLPYAIDGNAAALDDGTVLLPGQQLDEHRTSLYTISGGQVRAKDSGPQFLDGFAGGPGLLYGVVAAQPAGAMDQVALSTDRGKSWDYLEPR
ncbi:glycoside hydrolase [Kribbella sp. NBC_01505]|uniref:hypothetical protein n=1 Tax=Kribbella sp. NBC_01505 TaxID=2903580 RepID=UPI00386D96B3